MTQPWDPDGPDLDPAPPCRADPHPHPPGVRLVGELDLASRDVLLDALRALDHESGEIRIDVSELTFIDAAAVHEIMRFAHRRQPDRVIVESPSRLMLRVLDALFDPADLDLA